MNRTRSSGTHKVRILALLAAARPRGVSRDALLHAMYWDDPSGGPEWAASVLKKTIFGLRKDLGPNAISTIWASGYRLADGIDVTNRLPHDKMEAALRIYLARAEGAAST